MYVEATDDELLLWTARDPEAYGVSIAGMRRESWVTWRHAAARLRSCSTSQPRCSPPRWWQVAGTKPGQQPAIAWLLGIAHHKFADSVRRTHAEERARRKLGMEPLAVTDEALDRVEALASDGWADLLAVLDSLPPHQRDAVHARVVEHRDYLSIARELGCSEAVVRKRVSRGLNNLRVELENSA